MNLTEKVAYLKGLVEGMDIDDKKQGKIIRAMIDVLDDMALTVCDMEDEMAELTAQVDEIDEDLATVEDDIYDDEDDDEDEDDDDFFEVKCPECGDTIYVDDDMLAEEFIVCPNCGTEIEIEFDDDCECDCDCEDCKDEDEKK